MAKEDYVAVAADDWYQRRRKDDEGDFFRRVANQGPRKGEGGQTRQGIYCLTADGKLLTYKNAGQAPEVMRDVLQHGLAEWNKLPAQLRKPGGVQIPAATKTDRSYTRQLPPGGQAVRVFTRILDREGGTYRCGSCEFHGGDRPARDHLWLTAEDLSELFPPRLQKGQTLPLPEKLSRRILSYHLVDNTRGEPMAWKSEEVRLRQLQRTVEEVSPSRIRFRIEGIVQLANESDLSQASLGYDARLLGYVDYDPMQKKITRFDIVVLGEHWGQGPYTPGARPGRQPLGIAMELATGDHPADSVPPQGARDWDYYLGRIE